MSRDRWDVAVVARHPRITGLGRTQGEQQRVDAFAIDLARWLVGEPRETLQPLARVVTVVAARELRDARFLCRDRPLLAVESAARATEALWPYLRGPLEDDDEPTPPPPPPPEPTTSGMGGGAGSEGEEDGSEGEAPSSMEGDADEDAATGDGSEGDGGAEREPADVLRQLAGDGEDDPEDPDFEQLAAQLAALMGPGDDLLEATSEASEEWSEVGEAAYEAAKETHEVASRLERFVPGIGWSTAPGELTDTLLHRLDDLSHLLDKVEGIRELAERLGRIEEADRREGKSSGGSEEVAGVRLSGDVARALPSELALLSDESTEDLFYQRLMEHRLVSLQLTGAGLDGAGEGTTRGPVIACIDTSGSMQGAPEIAAKALVLAIARKILPQGRVMHLLLFGGPNEGTELRLRRGRGGLEQLLDFLGMAFQAGTDFDRPLLRAMALLEEEELERADVLVVTDGLARASKPILDRVAEVTEKTHARTISVVLGHGDVRGVEPFSDEVFALDPRESEGAFAVLRKVAQRP